MWDAFVVQECEEACAAPLLITECTFLDDECPNERAEEKGHVHVRQFADAWARGAFRNRVILLTHFSTKYPVRRSSYLCFSRV